MKWRQRKVFRKFPPRATRAEKGFAATFQRLLPRAPREPKPRQPAAGDKR
jgi:hypothetical protein